MITEQKLKEQCTPEFIKWMAELAEGFNVIGHQIYTPYLSGKGFNLSVFVHNGIFPILIHRAVEGWNKINDLKIRIFDEEIHTKKRLEHFAIGFYQFKNYQSQSLTKAECARLHCLLDVFKKQEERDE